MAVPDKAPLPGEKCPICNNDVLVEGVGIIDQCGMTYLETTTVECKTCEFKVWLPAKRGAEVKVATRK
jgi:hypothetical protein